MGNICWNHEELFIELNNFCMEYGNDSFENVLPIFRKKLKELSDRCNTDTSTFFIKWMSYNSAK